MHCVNAMRRLLLLLILLTRSCVSGNVNSAPLRGGSSGVLGKHSRKTTSVTTVKGSAPRASNSNNVPLFCPSVVPHGLTLRSTCYGFQAWLPETIKPHVTFVTIPLAHTSTMSTCDFKHPFRACDFHVCIYRHSPLVHFDRNDRPFDVALRFENATASYRVSIGVNLVFKNKYLYCGSVKRCLIWKKFRCAGTRQEELCRRVGFNGNWSLYVNAHHKVQSQNVGTRALFLSTYIENVLDISNPLLPNTAFSKIDTPVVIPVLEQDHTTSVSGRDTFDDDVYSEGSEDDQRNVISKEYGYDALVSSSNSKKRTLSQPDSSKADVQRTELEIANRIYTYVCSIDYVSSESDLPRCVAGDSNVTVARMVQLAKHKRRIDAVPSGNVLRDGDFGGRSSTPWPKSTTPQNRSTRIPGVTKTHTPHLLTTLPIHLPDDIHPGVPRSPGMVVGVGIAGGVLVGFVGFLLWRVSSGQHPFLLRHGASAAAAQQATELRSNLRRFSTFTGPSRGWEDDAYQHGNGNADLVDYYSDAGSFASIH